MRVWHGWIIAPIFLLEYNCSSMPKFQRRFKTAVEIRAWMCNYIPRFHHDVITCSFFKRYVGSALQVQETTGQDIKIKLGSKSWTLSCGIECVELQLIFHGGMKSRQSIFFLTIKNITIYNWQRAKFCTWTVHDHRIPWVPLPHW